MIWPFKKKDLPQPTPYDTRRHEMHRALFDAMARLEEATQATIVRQGVVSLYPDGPDKEAAKEEAEEQQFSLLRAIGSYDTLRFGYITYVQQNAGKFVTTEHWPVKWATSHEIIEQTYARFFQKTP